MINVVMLVKDDKRVIVNDNKEDIQYVYWTSLGFVEEILEQSSDGTVVVPPVVPKESKVENNADRDGLLGLPKDTLISMAIAKGINVDASNAKAEIVDLLIAQA